MSLALSSKDVDSDWMTTISRRSSAAATSVSHALSCVEEVVEHEPAKAAVIAFEPSDIALCALRAGFG